MFEVMSVITVFALIALVAVNKIPDGPAKHNHR